jgi:dienelactone hydrolase
MRTWLILAAGLATIVVGACRRHYPPDPVPDVDIVADDGIVLQGSYFSPGRFGPAIVLFHQCNSDRHAWDTLTSDLVRAGFHVLTFDYRAFGDSPGRRSAVDEQKVPRDADAAYAYLLSKPDVDRTRVVAGGASCGVAYSADLATRHREVKTLVFLSGGVGERARQYLGATPSLAVFGAAAGNRYDVAETRAAVAASRHPLSLFNVAPGSGHGAAMFDRAPELKVSLVEWLRARSHGVDSTGSH